MSLESIVQNLIYQDLSGDEIKTLVGKPPVVFTDIIKYSSLSQLLGAEKYVVLLYQTSSITTGHYVCISQNDDGQIRFVDSYGYTPAQIRQYTPYDDKFPAYVINLLAPYKVEYNTTDFQGKRRGISTCGRWASIFCKLRNMPLADIKQMLLTNKSHFLNNYDNVAVLLTMMSLKQL